MGDVGSRDDAVVEEADVLGGVRRRGALDPEEVAAGCANEDDDCPSLYTASSCDNTRTATKCEDESPP